MSYAQHPLLKRIVGSSLILQIAIGLGLGIALAALSPSSAKAVATLGNLFVGALKAVAPILVFILVIASIANHKQGQKTNIRPILILYMVGTSLAALTGVIASFMFPSSLQLVVGNTTLAPPSDILEVMSGLLFSMVENPIKALVSGNFIGILTWAIGLGLSLRFASDSTKTMITDLSTAISFIVKVVIRCAPIGIFGLVASTIAETGFSALYDYAHLLAVLVGSMLFVALVVNPIIVFFILKRNAYPLVLTCLKESGVTAFFTRSSAANIPVNLALCKRLGLNEDTYSISIPLGATINMAGAAITITVLALAATHTLGIEVDLLTALLLSIVASVAACGASGIAGGSLLLVPLACGLFGISNDIAMQVVAVGFIIGILQDSTETALNSSTDALFTAAVCLAAQKKEESIAVAT